MNYDLILVNGAPGIGKTTLSVMLGEHFASPVIDFGVLREFHLDKKWERKSDAEEQMTYEILVEMLKIYVRHGLKNIFINDLKERQVDGLNQLFKDTNSLVLTLTITDYSVLKERIVRRNCGWRDVDAAWQRNQSTIQREPWKNEVRVDVTVTGTERAFEVVLAALAKLNA